ncbi:MAG: TonB family protein, partial [Acidobacteria bacterium]|nr:TonB family protein [Acidobacteriota bacterium]
RRKGIFIIILLALVFFTLLALLFLYWPRQTERTDAPEVLLVVPAELKIRTKPGRQAPVLTTVTQGSELELLRKDGPWAEVRTSEGLTGWADRQSLETPSERQARLGKTERIRQLPFLDGVVTSDAELYAGAGLYYPRIGTLQKNDKVRVYTREQDFYAVAIGNDIAWVEVDDVDLAAGTVPALQVPAGDDATGAVVEDESGFDKPFEDFADELERIMAEREKREAEERTAERAAEPSAPSEAQPLSDGVYPNVPPGGTAPVLEQRTRPEYPTQARRAGVEGKVLIRAVVRKDGSVDRAEILTDQPFGLGDAARRAVQQWRFRPATYQGRPIDVYYTVSFDFTLD